MKKLALVLAAGACVAFAVPAVAANSGIVSGRVQIAHQDAQTTDFSAHRRWHRHRHWHRPHRHCWKGWRYGRRIVVCR